MKWTLPALALQLEQEANFLADDLPINARTLRDIARELRSHVQPVTIEAVKVVAKELGLGSGSELCARYRWMLPNGESCFLFWDSPKIWGEYSREGEKIAFGPHSTAIAELRSRVERDRKATDWHDGDKPKDGAPGCYPVEYRDGGLIDTLAFNGSSWFTKHHQKWLNISLGVAIIRVGPRIAPHHTWPAIPEPKKPPLPEVKRGWCEFWGGPCVFTRHENMVIVSKHNDDPYATVPIRVMNYNEFIKLKGIVYEGEVAT